MAGGNRLGGGERGRPGADVAHGVVGAGSQLVHVEQAEAGGVGGVGAGERRHVGSLRLQRSQHVGEVDGEARAGRRVAGAPGAGGRRRYPRRGVDEHGDDGDHREQQELQ